MNYGLIKDHNFSLESLESCMPWEREIYMHLANERTKKKQQEIDKANARRG